MVARYGFVIQKLPGSEGQRADIRNFLAGAGKTILS